MNKDVNALAASLYDDWYFEGPLATWHRMSLPTFSAFLREVTAGERLHRILDLGCGVGTYGEILRSLGGVVIGCEGAESAVHRARATGQYERVLCLDLETASGEHLEGPYDLIFSTEVIEHIADERRFCQLVAGSLTPGGLLVLTTTTYHFYVFYYLLCAVPRRRGACVDFLRGCFNDTSADRFVCLLWSLTGGHHHGFRAQRLLSCLTEASFRIERWRYANVQPVFPVVALDEPKFQSWSMKWAVPLLRGFGRALNAGCRRTGIYGANILVAAHKAGA